LVPGLYKRTEKDKKIPYYSLITNEKQSYSINIDALGEGECLNNIENAFVQYVTIEDYVDIISQKLWDENIKVSGSGKGTTTINLSGGTFFSNKNKSEVQKTLSDILTNFRFKESTYRAYESQNEYTSYTMETLKDSELY
jgi:hypothetical protein